MAEQSAWRRWRREVHDILEVGGDAHPAGRFVNAFLIVLIFVNAIAFAAETVDHLAARYGALFYAFNIFSVAVFTIEYLLRLWSAVDIPMLSRLPPWRARLRFALRPIMLIDLFAVLPFYLQWVSRWTFRALRVLRLFRLLKLVRYSPALQTLGRVLADEYRALLGALLVILVLLLFASTAMYSLEHDVQPDKFGSVPAAAWWALSTLTTVGYGDAVPITPLGKLLGGVVMLLGVGMIALPVAIIATGFNQESSRHQFVVTWSMVARVPLFATMDEARSPRSPSCSTRATIFRASPSCVPAMWATPCISSPAARPRSRSAGKRPCCKEGDFFGEMALLERRRHQHDVVAKTKCRIYVLDSQALSRLSRQHPEILRHIREVAEARARSTSVAAQIAERKRKRRVVSAPQAKPRPRRSRPRRGPPSLS